jgi:hypothetical protein
MTQKQALAKAKELDIEDMFLLIREEDILKNGPWNEEEWSIPVEVVEEPNWDNYEEDIYKYDF